MIDSFIALDLETTGLRSETDEIIEVGAVNFKNGQPTDEFHTLVNPRRSVPENIQRLTGISPQELAKAPTFERIATQLAAFLGSSPLVGHNLAFDLGFLAAKGVRPTGPVLDTYHLASLLFPQSQEYSLVAVARQCGLILPSEHRALNHASVTGIVCLELQKKIETLRILLKTEIARLGKVAGCGWHLLFDPSLISPSPLSLNLALPAISALSEMEIEPLEPKPTTIPINVEPLVSQLEPGGSIQSTVPGFEHRVEQVQMARAIAEAINQEQQLIVEAGTGTGKSMAYLLPAMSFALDNQTRVVLSTNTINLQEQLVTKDIPMLKKALNHLAGLKTAILKGRSNYLCLIRWDSLRQSLVLTQEEALFLARSLIWLNNTQTGDKAEIRLLNNEASIWSSVSAGEDTCHKESCHCYDEGHCFLYRARQQAESAHIVVTNHALLLSDMASGSRILPDYNHLIIDEAHHLEDEATEQLGVKVTSEQIVGHLNHISQKRRQGTATGLLAEIAVALKRDQVNSTRVKDVETLISQANSDLEDGHSCSSQFFRTLTQFISNRPGNSQNYESRLRLTPAVRSQPGWSEIEVNGENFILALHQLGVSLEKLHSSLENSEQKTAFHSGLAGRLTSCITDNAKFEQQLKDTVFNPEKSRVYWATSRVEVEKASLGSAPLQVGGILDESLYSSKKFVMLTSATLSIQGRLNFSRERLGLDSARELVLGSPFDYKNSTLICIPGNIPEPSQPGYQAGVSEAFAALAEAAGGRTLGLFTSHAALQATHQAVRSRLEMQGIQVLGQGVDGSPQQLLRVFQSNPHTLLLGTSSFWEGVDVPADTLNLLIIPRLPFPVPSDPIFEARCELMDDGFNEYSVPLAILRLKQGFGRLIRRRSDRGVMVLLDQRVRTKRYGRAFLESLPQCTIKTGPLNQVVKDVSAWLGRNPTTITQERVKPS